MYDLLILGSLMTGDKSGYKLQKIVGLALQPMRKVSSGTLYPTLEKLEKHGYVVFRIEDSGRKVKMLQITEKGIERFQELMAEDISSDAKRDDIFHFKVRSINSVPKEVQLKILAEFQQSTQEDLKIYQTEREHMLDHSERFPEQGAHFETIAAAHDLDIQLAQTKLHWIEEQIALRKNN